MFDILSTIEEWLAQGKQIALATVVETWGSSPRQAGAKMAVSVDMAMIGSVSGGCVEAAVLDEALGSIKDGRPRFLHFGVSDDTAWDVGLACGGQMSVYVESLDTAWWKLAADALKQHRATATVTVINGEAAGQKALVQAGSGSIYATSALTPAQINAFVEAAEAASEQRKTTHTTVCDLDVLIDVLKPSPRLIIVGGAHVAMALDQFARQLGFRVVLVDPRSAFATTERFPEVEHIYQSYPDKAFVEIGLDSETYIAILTHDPKIDDSALRTALPAHVPYIGILSSKRSHQQRIARLTGKGMDAALIDQVHVPIGIDIGAKAPEEIALCIMAEIVAVRNGVRA